MTDHTGSIEVLENGKLGLGKHFNLLMIFVLL